MPSVIENFSPGKKNYLGQNDGKKVDFASFLPTKYKKMLENALPAATKKPQTLVLNYLLVRIPEISLQI